MELLAWSFSVTQKQHKNTPPIKHFFQIYKKQVFLCGAAAAVYLVLYIIGTLRFFCTMLSRPNMVPCFFINNQHDGKKGPET